MAQIETWLNQDMMQAVKVRYLDGNLFSQDNAGNLIGVKLTRDGEDYSGGGTVSANVIRADGGTVAVTGALSGNVATVVLPQSAYAVPGVVSIVVKLTVSGAIITIAAVVANIYQSSTETAIDPGTIIPSIQTLINQINTAVASIPADYSSLWATLAPAFSTSTAYTIGQYVTYDGGLYRFTSAHPAGAWSSSDTTAAVVGNVFTDLQTGKADKTDPVFYGTISKGRKGNSQAGTGSVALGDNVTANGWFSQAEGQGTIANGSYQRASGKYNVADTGNTYAEMVGNGYAEVDPQTFAVTEHRSNARTLDWNGNETLAGDLTVNKGTANEVTLGAEVTNLKNAIGDIARLNTDTKTSTVSAINELASEVYEQETIEVEAENLFEKASTNKQMQLKIGETAFESGSSYGFYVPVTDYRGKELFITRTNSGNRLNGTFSADVPAIGVTYSSSYVWNYVHKRCACVTVPEDANYLYIIYYLSTADTLTPEECLAGMKIVEATEENLYDLASDDMLLSLSGTTYAASTTLYGFYVPIDDVNNPDIIVLQRDNVGSRLRYAFSVDQPAIGSTHYTTQADDSAKLTAGIITSGSKYLYVAYYTSSGDTITKEQAIAGMKIRYAKGKKVTVVIDNASRISALEDGKVDADQGAENAGKYLVVNNEGKVEANTFSTDATLSESNKPADSKAVGDHIFADYTQNLFQQKSESMLLSIETNAFTQGSTLYGFYIPVDPTISNKITIERCFIGERFRFIACTNIPDVGTTFDGSRRVYADKNTNRVVYSLENTDKYLYIAYYSSSQDTRTEEELLAGMTICYETNFIPKQSRLDRLDFVKGVSFVNGTINASGEIEDSDKHIISSEVRVDGRFGFSCSSDYVITAYGYDSNGTEIFAEEITNIVRYIIHHGTLRFVISASDESDITPATVDFSSIKFPGNTFSAKEYTAGKTYVLDAENCKDSDVYAYIDSVVESHTIYAEKELLCTEKTGLPIYYYTLGSGEKKAVIISGQHGPGSDGDPRDSVITVAKFVHDLVDGAFDNNSFLKTLHDEYTIVVIPVLNPYGFNNFSRKNSDGDDVNRDWASGNITQVASAKQLISDIDPYVIFDVHCNGAMPNSSPNVEMQFGLGATHNPLYKSAVRDKFKSYYGTDIAERTPNTTDTLQYYIQTTLQKLGGLLELRWWIKDRKWMHDYQAESANYAMLTNVLKYCDSVNGNSTYEFEHTPNQNQY